MDSRKNNIIQLFQNSEDIEILKNVDPSKFITPKDLQSLLNSELVVENRNVNNLINAMSCIDDPLSYMYYEDIKTYHSHIIDEWDRRG